MTFEYVLTTILGGFILPFLILLILDRCLKQWKLKGGFLGLFMIIGTTWFLNHGKANPFIHQVGPHFIDMGLATGVGVIAFGLFSGGSWRETLPNLLAALTGGVIAGVFLYVIA
ncbi:hypothetical protein [Streptococcus merionis]|uniref:Lin0368 family putative glycerol transporter subunit n=1 Tax=Streptococcus merionis TaxID=400065 RepID=UPI0026EE1194|nr:hypothetical protein [Streptococcus merionis]